MPIYEYRCQKCEKVFEEWLKSFDDTAPECPQCGGHAERIMSNTTFVLKGGGWYVTEYGNHKGEDGPVSAAHGDTAVGQGDTEHGESIAQKDNTPSAQAEPSPSTAKNAPQAASVPTKTKAHGSPKNSSASTSA